MTLGYRGEPDWRDMSEYAVHFTKGNGTADPFESMMSILSSGEVQARSRFGAARHIPEVQHEQRAACFSEIPLDRLHRLVERRGTKHGIAFNQEVLIAASGGRVWYVDKDSAPATAVRDMLDEVTQSQLDPRNPLFRLTPFIDFPGEYGGTQYRFEWEREWRVPGGLEFAPPDVAFLFIPEELHSAAHDFFEEARRENRGPVYDCPFLDPLWPDDRLQEALRI